MRLYPVLVTLLAFGLITPLFAAGESEVRFEPTSFNNMYELYEYNSEHGRNTLITTDSVLHTAHILFDYTLRAAELKHLDNNLRKLTGSMMSRMTALAQEEEKKQYIMAPPPYSYDRVAAYFGVGQKLLYPDAEIPEIIRPLVNKEVALILDHKGQTISPILGVIEDYTQYIPRGHYTRNDKFKHFFLAMMWFGRAGFPISGEKAPGIKLTKEEARANAWAGIVLARNLDESPLYRMPNSPTYFGLWQSIYQPTQFIVGDSDDLTPLEYSALSVKIFGDTLPGGWTADAQAKTDHFIAEAIAMRPPRILGTVQSDKEKAPSVSLRLFGQRFTPDSDIFQRLTHPKVQNRFMPTGLDVMAVLGSERALKLLQERDEIGKYEGYITQLNKVKQELDACKDADWQKTAYLLWMRVLKDMVSSPKMPVAADGTYPIWWQSTSWKDKQLNAVLGSWAELRHDTILYVKQPYAALTSMPAQPAKPITYVEPMPQVYQDIYQLVSTLQSELTKQGVFPEELAPNFKQFLQLLAGLRLQSDKELHPMALFRPPTEETMEGEKLIPQIGETLRSIETLPDPLRAELTGKEDTKMALIADVFTDPNSKRVLEVGVGRVVAVVAPVMSGQDEVQAYGPIFSYYEFPHPMDDRLTDGAWQGMLDRNEAPSWFILGRYIK